MAECDMECKSALSGQKTRKAVYKCSLFTSTHQMFAAELTHVSLFSSFSEDGMEVMERLIYLFRKFHQLKISNEEYACMKAINFLNQGEDNTARSAVSKSSLSACHLHESPLPFLSADIRGLSNTSQLEQLNKRYWYVCQDYTEYKYPHQPKRFPEIMMCLPEIRCIAGEDFGVREQNELFVKPTCPGIQRSAATFR